MGKEPGRWCGLQGQATRVTSLEKKAALTGAARLSREQPQGSCPGTAPSLASGRGWPRGGGREFLGSLGIENLGAGHNGLRFWGQLSRRFCGAGPA